MIIGNASSSPSKMLPVRNTAKLIRRKAGFAPENLAECGRALEANQGGDLRDVFRAGFKNLFSGSDALLSHVVHHGNAVNAAKPAIEVSRGKMYFTRDAR